jgi:hypothetical protein
MARRPDEDPKPDELIELHTGDDIYGGRIEGAVGTMERDEQNGMPPEKVAAAIFAIASRKRIKPLYTLGFNYKLLYFLQKILPIGIVNRIVGLLYMKSRDGGRSEKDDISLRNRQL